MAPIIDHYIVVFNKAFGGCEKRIFTNMQSAQNWVERKNNGTSYKILTIQAPLVRRLFLIVNQKRYGDPHLFGTLKDALYFLETVNLDLDWQLHVLNFDDL